MRKLILGTAGHIDHGKTSLVRMLTGIDTDRLAEEKRRGITIDLGFARLALGDGLELGIVDVPGHEGFVRNMLAGATGIDLVLLVVAADEGIMPQTREHLAIVDLLGVRGGVVAITKTDLVEAEWLDLIVEELREALDGTPFAAAPVVPVSAQTGSGLDELRAVLRTAAEAVDQRSGEDLFRLPIDRVFSVRGTGTVLTGTIWAGRVHRDQVARILPQGKTARVRSVQVHGRDTETAEAGQRAALALVGVDRDELRRGDVLVADAPWQPTTMLTARLRVVAGSPWSIRSRQRVRFHLGTSEVMARVVLLDDDELAGGCAGWVQLRLEAPVVARTGDRFVVRSYSPVTTIGGGTVVEPAPSRRKRLDPSQATRLDALLAGSIDERITARVEIDGWRGTRLSDLPVLTGGTPAEIAASLDRIEPEILARVGDRAFVQGVVLRARGLLLEAIDAAHAAHPLRPGLGREELRRAIPTAAPAALGDWMLNRLLAEGSIEALGGLVARAGFRPRLDAEQREVRDRFVQLLDESGLTPPTISELPGEFTGRREFPAILKLLEDESVVVPLTPDLFVTRATADAAIARARRELARKGALAPADFKQVFPISRKFLIPLLEYFDRSGVTERRGDARTIVEASPAA